MGEFSAIAQLFQDRATLQHPATRIANGDDASVHAVPQGMELVVSTDSAVSGVHWPVDMPLDIAAKRAMGAALSDLAAMGAEATWVWLSVVAKDMQSLQAISDGIVDICQQYKLELAGGDTVHAAVDMLNITVAGLLPTAQAMTRSDAQIGDDIWLCGDLGLSAWGLQQWLSGNKHDKKDIEAFQTIQPLLQEGVQLRQLGVRCCMDVSDGLLQDAGHIARASNMLLSLDVQKIKQLAAYPLLMQSLSDEEALSMMLSGGEDFALLFTAKATLRSALENMNASMIGVCKRGKGTEVLQHGQQVHFESKGYDHFGEHCEH
ncbi:MAG: thiamine-phosphate kinase [Ghiorsea sp.]